MAGKNHQSFRAGVGAVVQNREGQVLVLERSDRAGAWQLPQGGLHRNEEPEEALWRELREETGLTRDRVGIVDIYPEWLIYELPPGARNLRLGRGQAHRWFLLRFTGDSSSAISEAVDLAKASSREFRAWRWMPLERIAEETVSFRRGVYRRLAERWAHASP